MFDKKSDKNYQTPTKGGDANVHILPDGTYAISLNQPENTEEQSFIELNGVKLNEEDVKVKVVVSGTTPLAFNKIQGFGGYSMASIIGYGGILLGFALFIASFVPALRFFLISWKLGATTMGAGFGIVLVDRFLTQYGMISIFLLLLVAAGWFFYSKGIKTETPEHLKIKK